MTACVMLRASDVVIHCTSERVSPNGNGIEHTTTKLKYTHQHNYSETNFSLAEVAAFSLVNMLVFLHTSTIEVVAAILNMGMN